MAVFVVPWFLYYYYYYHYYHYYYYINNNCGRNKHIANGRISAFVFNKTSNFKVAFKEVCPQITWEQIVDPLISAEHTSRTTDIGYKFWRGNWRDVAASQLTLTLYKIRIWRIYMSPHWLNYSWILHKSLNLDKSIGVLEVF